MFTSSRHLPFLVTLLLIALFAPPVRAACPDAVTLDQLAADWLAHRPAAALPADLDGNAALCAQAGLLARLIPSQGPAVGYKVGLTTPAMQQRFHHHGPVRGVLLRSMLLADGAEVPADFGARPVYEADLIAEVADAGINTARDAAEALAHVKSIRPFIELPDLTLASTAPMNGQVLTAINVGARLGVMGAPLPATAALLVPLGSMEVVLEDAQSGREISRGKGADNLGHPLNALVWLARDLAAAGGRLEAGDLVSLGSFTPLQTPVPGQAVRVRYPGLPGTPSVSVRFR
ncbi:MAG: hypothetical protein JSR19_08700 [Proteobacteria bacterium]|nr:hypothetical protein [Pseudomonadota bacterium]HQR04160.1 hypothetical protein [Rhodocyclaceae bacterium]